MTDASTRKRARAVFFSAIMVISMAAVGVGGFAGSAAANTVNTGGDITVDNIDDLRTNVSGAGDATSGDTISLEAGNYDVGGNDISVTLDNITIEGPTEDTATISGDGSGNGVTVDEDNITVRNLKIEGFSNGIRLTGSHSNITFQNVDSVRNDARGMEIRNDADLNTLVLNSVNFSDNNGDGLRVATEASIDGFTIRNSQFNDNLGESNSGIEVYQSESTPGQLNDVVIADTEFKNNGQKGIYVEKLSNALLDNVTVNGVERDTYGFNTGIDINLKYDDYENITIRSSTIANVSEGDPSDPSFSAAIAIKARDDSTSYANTPATLTDVTIDDLTVRDSFNGLRFGEVGVDYSGEPQGPTDVSLSNSQFENNSGYHLEDLSGSLGVETARDSSNNNEFTTAATLQRADDSLVTPNIWATVQSAVDAAESDQTVSVAPGTYNESVSISKANVTLEGAGTDSTNIIGDGENVGSQPHAAIHVDDGSGPVQDVTIEGFTVENPDGKYGIFAGTGTVNKDQDGISGLVIRDNVIQNVSTNSTGRALTGGPAGISIRADYGTDGNPGIEISGNDISNVQNGDGPEPVGITLKSFTGDAGFGFDSNGDPVTDTSSPPATDTDIVNNTISDINSTSGGYATKGISFSGEFEDVDVINNSLTDIISPGSTAIAITFSENNKGDNPEDYKYDIDDDGNGERIGPRDFDVRNNEIGQVTASDARAVNIGGYEQLGDHSVTQNNINDGEVVRYFGNQAGFDPADADALKAQLNYWGDGQTPLAAGQVVYDPVLTTPIENVENKPVTEIEEYGSVIEVDNNGGEITLAVGFSAPPEQNASELFGDIGIDQGAAYRYDNDGAGYVEIDTDFTPTAGEVIVITTDDAVDEDVVVPINTSVEGAAASPESVEVDNGWNLVATGAADEVSDIPVALNGGSIQGVQRLQAQPRQPGLANRPRFGAFEATWLFINGDGRISTGYAEGQNPFLYNGEVLYPPGLNDIDGARLPTPTDDEDDS